MRPLLVLILPLILNFSFSLVITQNGTYSITNQLEAAQSLGLTWNDAVVKGENLYQKMRSGCYPSKEHPPSILEMKNDGWICFPWPVKAGRLKEEAPNFPEDVIDELNLSNDKHYFHEVLAKSGEISASLQMQSVDITDLGFPKSLKYLKRTRVILPSTAPGISSWRPWTPTVGSMRKSIGLTQSTHYGSTHAPFPAPRPAAFDMLSGHT